MSDEEVVTSGLVVRAPQVTNDQIELIKRTVAKDATADELKLYFYDCQRQGVHPLDKLIHFTKRSGKYTPVTSIDFMRSRAADSCEYAGNDDASFQVVEGKKHPDSATVTVFRLVQGQRCAFTATARWTEYVPSQAFMWGKMPYTMLAKCAEALALRKAFPRQLSGLYSAEEMEQAKKQADFTPPTAEEEEQGKQQVEEASGLSTITCKVKQINHKSGNVAVVNCILNGREVLLRVSNDMADGIGKVGDTIRAEVKRLPSIVEMYQVLDWLPATLQDSQDAPKSPEQPPAPSEAEKPHHDEPRAGNGHSVDPSHASLEKKPSEPGMNPLRPATETNRKPSAGEIAIHTARKERNVDDATYHDYIKEKYGAQHTRDLTQKQRLEVQTWLLSWEKPKTGGEELFG